jgi:hypothetical protein
MEQQADLSQPALMAPPEPNVAVPVRQRASRRAVKQAVNAAEAEARALNVAEQLVGWDNQHVGASMLQYARLERLSSIPRSAKKCLLNEAAVRQFRRVFFLSFVLSWYPRLEHLRPLSSLRHVWIN